MIDDPKASSSEGDEEGDEEDEDAPSTPRPERCPRCGSDRIVRIVYGMPTFEAGDAEERGEIILGGCMPMGRDWGCAACGYEFPGEMERMYDVDVPTGDAAGD